MLVGSMAFLLNRIFSREAKSAVRKHGGIVGYCDANDKRSTLLGGKRNCWKKSAKRI
jgi:hypothetical protein